MMYVNIKFMKISKHTDNSFLEIRTTMETKKMIYNSIVYAISVFILYYYHKKLILKKNCFTLIVT
jgi:hypothetical protein